MRPQEVSRGSAVVPLSEPIMVAPWTWMIRIRSPAARLAGKRPFALSVLAATVIVVLPVKAFAVSAVYSFTTVLAVVTVLAPCTPRWEKTCAEKNKNEKIKAVLRSFIDRKSVV